MYTDRSVKKVLLLALYLAAIILGVYMSFIHKADYSVDVEQSTQQQEKEVQPEGENVSMGYGNYVEADTFCQENESADELYREAGDMEISIYFSNTELLDNGSMPLEVQAVLVESAQSFLVEKGYKDVTELYIDENSYDENEERIVFICYMDGYKEVLQVEYLYEEDSLRFCIFPS